MDVQRNQNSTGLDMIANTSIEKEVLTGLSKRQKELPPKLLYDKKGSEIFEKICLLDEYYPTRSENEILQTFSSEISKIIGRNALIIEPGSGAGDKVRHLIPHLIDPAGYVPIEISQDILYRMTTELRDEFPGLEIYPICADFNQNIEIPIPEKDKLLRKVVFFPGSTIGNFNPDDVVKFLEKMGQLIGPSGGLLVGVDLKKDPIDLKKAYNDSCGVTSDLNMNLLERLNRECGATFNRDYFSHDAFYNKDKGRVEMHLVSKVKQFIKIHGTVLKFEEGETIHTESSYKYNVDEFVEICALAKYKIKKTWKDRKRKFCVYFFEREQVLQ